METSYAFVTPDLRHIATHRAADRTMVFGASNIFRGGTTPRDAAETRRPSKKIQKTKTTSEEADGDAANGASGATAATTRRREDTFAKVPPVPTVTRATGVHQTIWTSPRTRRKRNGAKRCISI